MGKKREIITEEQLRSNRLSNATLGLKYIKNPTFFFNVGDEVSVGSLNNVIVIGVLFDGAIYEVEYDYTDTNYGNPIRKHGSNFFSWHELRRKHKDDDHGLIKNSDIFLRYSTRAISDIVSKRYAFGIDFNAVYQRGYVWTLEDKQNLIRSIFENIDIGRFLFARNDYKSQQESYRVIDGKQRVNAIISFYEDQFLFNGLTFTALTKHEQNHILDYGISTAEIDNLSLEQELRIFLMTNTAGKVMSREDLNRALDLYEKSKESR
jgi:hypothetical protein